MQSGKLCLIKSNKLTYDFTKYFKNNSQNFKFRFHQDIKLISIVYYINIL